MVIALGRETTRKVAISTFICAHLLALAWWNLGVIDYRPPALAPAQGDGWTKLRAGVDAVDRRGAARALAKTYMRATGLWQRWIMFGPDVPHETGHVEVHGIVGFDARRRPILDPDPIRDGESATIADINQMIGNPPCGWDRSARPQAVFLRGAYARFLAAEASRARARDYVGVQLLCVLRTLEAPGELPPEDLDALQWRVEALWAGPLLIEGGPR